MSGPKVVRIVTREEVIALCQRQLARLDAHIEAWKRVGLEHGVVSEAETEALVQRRKSLQTLLEDDAFEVLQKQIASEIYFLDQNMAERLEKAAKLAQEARAAKRRRIDAARQAKATIDATGGDYPTELRKALDVAISGQADDDMASATLARVFEYLACAPGNGGELSAEQSALASQLGDGSRVESFSVWRSRIEPQEDPRISHIEQRLSELELLGPEAEVSDFARRLNDLTATAFEKRQSLLVDSLLADLSAATSMARARSSARRDLMACKAELEAVNGSVTCHELAQRIGRMIAANDVSDTSGLIAEAAALIASETARADAEYRRQAILEGLSRIGYEVREGMQTEFAAGPVVVRNPSTPGYGVEIGGPATAERLQMRVVSFDTAGSDASRDRDIETQWCGDVDKLTTLLADAGVDLAIERATKAGAHPVKTVANSKGNEMRHDVAIPAITQARPQPKS